MATLSSVADASLLRGLTARGLRDGSDAILRGRVTNVRVVRTAGRIETVARVRIRESWRGPVSGSITVRSPGGTLGSRRLVVPGAAAFERGDHLLLFLYRDGGAWRPVGMYQGVWHVDPADPERLLVSDSGGAAILAPTSGTAAVAAPARRLTQLLGEAEAAR